MTEQVFYNTGKTTKKFQDQSFFDTFNWQNFEQGDTVWLEDYDGSDVSRIAGIFKNHRPGQVTIRLVKNVHGQILGHHSVENINQMSQFWQRYL
jgi:hypothetical protein